MPTQPYVNKAGKRVPSVTTIISRFKESGGLVHWAWQLGRDGLDYRTEREKAADAGTAAHAMVEADIKGEPFDASPYADEILEPARMAFGAYKEWTDQTKLKPVATEVPLVSEAYQFGGCLDAMLVNGKLSLGDWKTSNAVYADYLIQLAAYAILWEENHPFEPIEGGFHLLRFSKGGDFSHHFYPKLDEAKRAFVLMRELYDISAALKKRAA